MKRKNSWQKILSLAVALTMTVGLLAIPSLAADSEPAAETDAEPVETEAYSFDTESFVPATTENGAVITKVGDHEYNVELFGRDTVTITAGNRTTNTMRWISDNTDVARRGSRLTDGRVRVNFSGKEGTVTISYQELGWLEYETKDYFIFNVKDVSKTTLTYETNGGSALEPEQYPYGQVVELTRGTVRDGYQFTGWYADPECTQLITSIQMNGDKTVYAGWDTPKIPEPLNSADHFRYAYGSTDGLFHPVDNITRAEVAALMYNLLKDEVRDAYTTDVNPFPDVNEDDWFNVAVSTMVKMGAISGYPDGTFAPYAPMTRGEFTAMMVTLDKDEPTVKAQFTDTEGHWAEAAISKAALNGWVAGMPDGSFQPDRNILRCESISILNAMLGRKPAGVDSLLDGMKVWPDNMDTEKWYYLAVQEATTSHECTFNEDKTENWTALK